MAFDGYNTTSTQPQPQKTTVQAVVPDRKNGAAVFAAPRPTPQSSIPTGKFARLLPAWEKFARERKLTECQTQFGRRFFHGANLFLTGAAGTGKSYLTKSLFQFLVDHKVSVGVTATTGIAAFNIGGQTIHSFAGLGLADEPVENLIAKANKNGRVKARIRAAEVLFLDEVSMAKGDLLDKVDGVFRAIRRSSSPFGEVQLVAIGDCLQLPPVFRGTEKHNFFFESAAWRDAQVESVVLRQQMRQKADSRFLEILNEIRIGETRNLDVLNSRVDAGFPNDEIDAVRIFCKNIDVDNYNADRLNAINAPSKVFHAKDNGDDRHTESFNKNCPAPEELLLKIGAQVVLLANLDVEEGFVNGAVGVVKGFTPDGVRVKFKTGTTVVGVNEWSIKEQDVGIGDGKIRFKTVATRKQIPLKVCFALTTHRVQGMTLDRAVIDMSGAFGDSMVYVALSRVRDLESLSLAAPIDDSAVKANRKCVEFYRSIGGMD